MCLLYNFPFCNTFDQSNISDQGHLTPWTKGFHKKKHSFDLISDLAVTSGVPDLSNVGRPQIRCERVDRQKERTNFPHFSTFFALQRENHFSPSSTSSSSSSIINIIIIIDRERTTFTHQRFRLISLLHILRLLHCHKIAINRFKI